MLAFAFAVFSSALLVFQVQPILARYILPWFGGSPGVWTLCMLFFQLGLLCGYYYAHWLAKHVPIKRQPALHLLFILFSMAMLPITPNDELAYGYTDPTVGVMTLLLTTVGLPFVVLSASAPLLQHWFSHVYPQKSPFRLYALSNAGSLLALVSYPFIIEPNLSLHWQTWSWSMGYVVFFMMMLWSARSVWSLQERSVSCSPGEAPSVATRQPPQNIRITWTDRGLWMALAACGSIILLAATSQMSQDVAVVPFLWVLPLSLYLLSFIICFERDRWYYRPLWLTGFVVSVTALVTLLHQDYAEEDVSLAIQVLVYSASIFTCCMLCHGELVRRRPAAENLTSFYLYVSAGGAVGGLFVGIVAPLIFDGYWELHGVLIIISGLSGSLIARDIKPVTTLMRRALFVSAWSIGVCALGVALYQHAETQKEKAIYSTRGFYGVLHVYEYNRNEENHYRALYYGRINHGEQWLREEYSRSPSTYYTADTGVGLALTRHTNRKKRGEWSHLNIGVIGLGTGTLAAYGRSGDKIRFYEINDQTQTIAENQFSYLQDSLANIEVIIGDGRVSLAKELKETGTQAFDVLVIDAFSGDAIPVHLLTAEAMNLYHSHLKEDGIIAFHVTNIHINLFDVVRHLAEQQDMTAIHVHHDAENPMEYSNDWILVTRDAFFINDLKVNEHRSNWEGEPKPHIWTDDHSNLLEAVNW